MDGWMDGWMAKAKCAIPDEVAISHPQGRLCHPMGPSQPPFGLPSRPGPAGPTDAEAAAGFPSITCGSRISTSKRPGRRSAGSNANASAAVAMTNTT